MWLVASVPIFECESVNEDSGDSVKVRGSVEEFRGSVEDTVVVVNVDVVVTEGQRDA